MCVYAPPIFEGAHSPMAPPVLPGPPNGIQLDSLDPDVDGDGKVSALERKLHGKLRAADREPRFAASTQEMVLATNPILDSAAAATNKAREAA